MKEKIGKDERENLVILNIINRELNDMVICVLSFTFFHAFAY